MSFRFSAKELDKETGFYYYGARYLDPKYSRWISADPAMNTGEYFPVAPIDDEAKKHNQNLPGMGGVFNHINANLFAYAANNPIKYTDPDGRNPALEIAGEKVLESAAKKALTKVAAKTAAKLGLCAADGPLPIGDVIAAAWTLWDICSYLADQADAKAKAVATEQNKTEQTLIYRTGSGNATNLTPREVDIEGLSYTTEKPVGRDFTVTTIEAINATGVLIAVKDGKTHVSVTSLDRSKYLEWQASRANALASPHPYTKLLQSISVKIKAGGINYE